MIPRHVGPEIVLDNGTTYEPFISEDGCVGYMVVRLEGDKQPTALYLNPSDPDDGIDNVFVYRGQGDPAFDEPLHWYYTFPEDDSSDLRS